MEAVGKPNGSPRGGGSAVFGRRHGRAALFAADAGGDGADDALQVLSLIHI